MTNLTKADIVRSTLIVLLLVGIALLLVKVTATLLLIFAAVLVAAVIRAFSDPMQARGMPETASVLLALLIIVGLLVGFGYLFGQSLSAQFDNLGSRLTESYEVVRDWISRLPFGSVIESATPDIQNLFGRAVNLAWGALGLVTNLVLVLVGGIYLALDPGMYARGFSKLFPKAKSGVVLSALSESGQALRRYLAAQLVTNRVWGCARNDYRLDGVRLSGQSGISHPGVAVCGWSVLPGWEDQPGGAGHRTRCCRFRPGDGWRRCH